jgi:hypothetical protein
VTPEETEDMDLFDFMNAPAEPQTPPVQEPEMEQGLLF